MQNKKLKIIEAILELHNKKNNAKQEDIMAAVNNCNARDIDETVEEGYMTTAYKKIGEEHCLVYLPLPKAHEYLWLSKDTKKSRNISIAGIIIAIISAIASIVAAIASVLALMLTYQL